MNTTWSAWSALVHTSWTRPANPGATCANPRSWSAWSRGGPGNRWSTPLLTCGSAAWSTRSRLRRRARPYVRAHAYARGPQLARPIEARHQKGINYMSTKTQIREYVQQSSALMLRQSEIIDGIRVLHSPRPLDGRLYCRECRKQWPCPTSEATLTTQATP